MGIVQETKILPGNVTEDRRLQYPYNLLEDLKKGVSQEIRDKMEQMTNYQITRAIHFVQDVESITPEQKDFIANYYINRLSNKDICQKNIDMTQCRLREIKRNLLSRYRRCIPAFTNNDKEFTDYKMMRYMDYALVCKLQPKYSTPDRLIEAVKTNPASVWSLKNIGTKDIIAILEALKSWGHLPVLVINMEDAAIKDKLMQKGITNRYDLYAEIYEDVWKFVDKIDKNMAVSDMRKIINYARSEFVKNTGREFLLNIRYD